MRLPTVHSVHRMLLPIQGEGTLVFDGERIPFAAGVLVFCFAGESFCAECSDGSAYMYISFGGGRAEELFRRFAVNKQNRAFDGFDGLIPLWKESLSRASEQNIDLASESVLLYTFSRLNSQVSHGSELIRKIMEITEDSFTDPGLSLSSLADMLAYNPKYISHVFKQKTGMSYSEYLRDMRIKHAVSLLDYGLDSVKNVALLSGFSDPLYFSSVFKKNIGVSPKEYKNGKNDR